MANVIKKSASGADLSAFSMNTQAVANPVTPIKTKAAYKLYPPGILNGTGLKNNKRRKCGLQRSCTRKDSEELTPPMAKKGKDSPQMEEKQPLVLQPAKPAEASTMTDPEEVTPPVLKMEETQSLVDQPTTCEASTMTDAEEITPSVAKKGKDSPLMEEPQPLMDQLANPAEDQLTSSEASPMGFTLKSV
ncbi:uncharacterized protein LOC121825849 [Peromyscus maniculatus bairdii]|uniref:uncharacterized protein LOC121825849 n=1 Tax=Peromyscus maniculatus bairdii TaxID=230844 RepID=UPI001C2DF848|nr:testis-specific gene A8 protein-like [Peromyscus maniculatus bairdii]